MESAIKPAMWSLPLAWAAIGALALAVGLLYWRLWAWRKREKKGRSVYLRVMCYLSEPIEDKSKKEEK